MNNARILALMLAAVVYLAAYIVAAPVVFYGTVALLIAGVPAGLLVERKVRKADPLAHNPFVVDCR